MRTRLSHKFFFSKLLPPRPEYCELPLEVCVCVCVQMWRSVDCGLGAVGSTNHKGRNKSYPACTESHQGCNYFAHRANSAFGTFGTPLDIIGIPLVTFSTHRVTFVTPLVIGVPNSP